MKKIKIITWNLGHALFNKEYFQNVSQNKISFKNIFPNKRKIVIANATNQIELIKKIDADIVLLQETSKLYLSNYFINQIKLIKKHLPYYNLYYTSHTKWPLINSGNAIMSKIVGKFDKNFFPFRTKGHLRNKLYSNKSISVLRIPIDNKELVVFCIQ